VEDATIRAARHAALSDPLRLSIVDELARSDRAPSELLTLVDVPSNLLAHHLDVLERVGLISRHRSSGDGRRRYIRLERGALHGLTPGRRVSPGRALFVCTHNSARSQLAAALWQRTTGQPAVSAGTHPAPTVHPGAVASAERAGLDLSGAEPHHLDAIGEWPSLVITVCDRAHEELGDGTDHLHWSIPDPVPVGTRKAFDTARNEIAQRIDELVAEPTP
jgi:protein-tyrosine-phosphatase/DNA-binding transcriptional ArsR family regulator